MNKVSYALGIGIGRQLASMGAESLNIDDFAQAVKDAIAGKLQMSEQEAQELVQNFFAEQEAKAQAAAAEKGKVAKEAGEKFLAENGKKEGIITTKSGLQYQVLREGNGKAPKATDQVECHYEGTLIDGTKFDSSYDRGQTATFPLSAARQNSLTQQWHTPYPACAAAPSGCNNLPLAHPQKNSRIE